jgi:ribosomal subunit interface protein
MNKPAAHQDYYNISITGRHVMVTDAMKKHALDKLAKLERVAHHIVDVHLIMDIQKLEHRVDIVIKFSHVKIKVHAASEDMYKAQQAQGGAQAGDAGQQQGGAQQNAGNAENVTDVDFEEVDDKK